MVGIGDGEVDFSNPEIFGSNNLGVDDLGSGSSMESFFEEILRDTHACTHTHTCNPPGPDNTHTHTCFHTHTKILPAADEEKSADSTQDSSSKAKKRSGGNREAVRKYREKKKARTACLEEEVLHLTALNQQLMRRLQGQGALEAEIARLKCLLADFRGRIDGELGSYPYQKSIRADKAVDGQFLPPLPGGYVLNTCNVRCNADVACPDPILTSEGKDGLQQELGSSMCGSTGCGLVSGSCQSLKDDVAVTSSGLSAMGSCEKQRKGTFAM
uniref:BZIP domain-containing protein n=1 Tax=Araucaria cunninghamii TaxID=56994 RepID=A0A0D6R0G4_ARACU